MFLITSNYWATINFNGLFFKIRIGLWELWGDMSLQIVRQYVSTNCEAVCLYKMWGDMSLQIVRRYVSTKCEAICLYKMWRDMSLQNERRYVSTNCEAICLYKMWGDMSLQNVTRYVSTKCEAICLYKIIKPKPIFWKLRTWLYNILLDTHGLYLHNAINI